jgi:uncharacterized membrane-anchored protein YjiN (DUF445 family)
MDQDLALVRLRAMQRLALALLVVAGVTFLLALAYEPLHPGVGYLRAFCEAALVGGLADWFAVTALFRRPLGLPIPHTAIIPENKDRLGEALGEFVERNFLSTEAVAAKLADVDFADVLAGWLGDSARSRAVADRLADWLPRLLDALGEEPMRRFIRENFASALHRIEMAPLAAELLDTLTAHDRHQELLDELVLQAERFLREAEPEIRARVRAKTAWLWQKLGIDERIADRLIEAAEQALAEIGRDPAHAWRQRFTQLIREYVGTLRHSDQHQRRAERFKETILAYPGLGEYLGAVWDEVRARVREDAGRDDSRIRADLAAALVWLGERLRADSEVRDVLNGWMRGVLGDLVRARRNEVAGLISSTVRRWDARTVSDKVERAIGRDLQYIRINGTLIGGLVGVLLHAASQVFSS